MNPFKLGFKSLEISMLSFRSLHVDTPSCQYIPMTHTSPPPPRPESSSSRVLSNASFRSAASYQSFRSCNSFKSTDGLSRYCTLSVNYTGTVQYPGTVHSPGTALYFLQILLLQTELQTLLIMHCTVNLQVLFCSLSSHNIHILHPTALYNTVFLSGADLYTLQVLYPY